MFEPGPFEDTPPPEGPWDGPVIDPYMPTPEQHLARAVAGPAGLDLWHELHQICPALLTADDAVTYLQQIDRLVAHVNGLRHQALTTVTGVVLRDVLHEPLARFVDPRDAAQAEMTAACRVHRATMDARIEHSIDLQGPWRPMLDALLTGEVSNDHVNAIGRELRHAPGYRSVDPREAAQYAKTCRTVLAIVISYARTHTPGECRRRTASAILACDRAGARRRRREVAATQHGVHLDPGDEPGTAQITAVLPIAHAHAVYRAVDTLARDDRFETGAACHTLGQRRAAALATLTLGDPGSVAVVDSVAYEAKIRTRVDVVVPLSTLIGIGDDGAVIAGNDATADTVRDLLATCDGSSTLRRLVTDRIDDTETIIDLGRTRYPISDVQRHLVTLRDRTCRHPGCTTPADRCEVDHAQPWNAGGSTDLANLGSLCKYHHQLKTHSGWRITRSSRSGACTWTSPLDRIYEHEPPPLLPQAPPQDPGPPPF